MGTGWLISFFFSFVSGGYLMSRTLLVRAGKGSCRGGQDVTIDSDMGW